MTILVWICLILFAACSSTQENCECFLFLSNCRSCISWCQGKSDTVTRITLRDQKERYESICKTFVLPMFRRHFIFSEILTRESSLTLRSNLDLELKHLDIRTFKGYHYFWKHSFGYLDKYFNISRLVLYALLLHYSRSVIIKMSGRIDGRLYWKINKRVDNNSSFTFFNARLIFPLF